MKKKITGLMLIGIGVLVMGGQVNAVEMTHEEKWDYHLDSAISEKYQEELQKKNEGMEVGWTTPQVLYPSISELEETEKKAIDQINELRTKAGLKKVSLNKDLTTTASAKVEDMYYNQYFNETSPTYGTAEQMVQDFGNKNIEGKIIQWIHKESREAENENINWSKVPVVMDKELKEIGISYFGEKGVSEIYWALIGAK